ncbi:unnamed protein product [Strongylus vulgaris]|uniref:Uncharacterized protein n=1 Tax=Strongylus vulgaris TaxID=40348 RepID=A0A3P7I983_STRVU|nr:unnamed protein product [Strongylus vulgaris]
MQYGGPMRVQQGQGIVSGPTPLLSLNTQGLYPPPGGKILINPNFRGPVPSGPGPIERQRRFPGGPASVLPLVGAPSVLPTIVPGQGPIIPRLPNGIPLTGLPSNHGAAGFGPPPSNRPQMPPPIMPGMNAGISRPAPVGQWDQAVEAFLSGSTQRQRSPPHDRDLLVVDGKIEEEIIDKEIKENVEVEEETISEVALDRIDVMFQEETQTGIISR